MPYAQRWQQAAPTQTILPSPLEALTSPVPYISSLPLDPFRKLWPPGPYAELYPYEYRSHVGETGEGLYLDTPGLRGNFLFSLWSYGPDQAGNTLFTGEVVSVLNYDPSNGTTSSGDLVLCGP
jgi:hypothetical protein